MQLRGTISAVRYRDGRFCVFVVDDGHGEVVCTGRAITTAAVGMPVALEVEAPSEDGAKRSGRGSESVEVLAMAPPGPKWGAFAGVCCYLEAGGVESLTGLSRQLALHFGPDLPEVLLTGRERLRELPALSADPGRIDAELDAAEQALSCAAELGAAGLSFLVERATATWGRAGPVICAEDPTLAVSDGLVDPAEVVPLCATEEARARLVAVAAVRERMVNGGRVVSAKGLSRIAAQLFPGEGVELGRATDGGGLVELGGMYLASIDCQLWSGIAEQLGRIGAEAAALPRLDPPEGAYSRTIVSHLADAPISLVETPPGAGAGWLDALRATLEAAGCGLELVVADRRGLLSSPTPVIAPTSRPAVVVFAEVHRLSLSELLSRLVGLPAGARVVLAGDAWLWAPGHGAQVFAELVRARSFPLVTLPGTGGAVALRRGEEVLAHPQVRIGPAPAEVRKVFLGPALHLVRKVGRRAIVTSRTGGLGPGALGIVTALSAAERVATFELEAGGSERVPLRCVASGDNVPVSLLPGVATDALALSRRLSRHQLYAVLAAAGTLWVPDRSTLEVYDAAERTTSLLSLVGQPGAADVPAR